MALAGSLARSVAELPDGAYARVSQNTADIVCDAGKTMRYNNICWPSLARCERRIAAVLASCWSLSARQSSATAMVLLKEASILYDATFTSRVR